jgi:hypothetical protein
MDAGAGHQVCEVDSSNGVNVKENGARQLLAQHYVDQSIHSFKRKSDVCASDWATFPTRFTLLTRFLTNMRLACVST